MSRRERAGGSPVSHFSFNPWRIGGTLPRIRSGLLAAACIVLSAGCALTQEVTRTPRNAIEQLLLTQAVERALADFAVPIPGGETITVEVSGMIDSSSWDLAYVRDAVSARLGELDYLVKTAVDDAAYLVRVKVESMGTNQGKAFIGLPPIQSIIIPFALPQITLYEEQDQLAHVQLHLDVYERQSGRFMRSTAKFVGSTYYNQYVVFFFFSFRLTDLIDPP